MFQTRLLSFYFSLSYFSYLYVIIRRVLRTLIKNKANLDPPKKLLRINWPIYSSIFVILAIMVRPIFDGKLLPLYLVLDYFPLDFLKRHSRHLDIGLVRLAGRSNESGKALLYTILQSNCTTYCPDRLVSAPFAICANNCLGCQQAALVDLH